VPARFRWLQRLGDIEETEMERVFNMGIGMAVVVSAYYADSVRQQLEASGLESWPIGHVAEGERGVVWG
jgi:phosphoribosylformylglycinamidine cyclo-ligase